MDLDPSKLIDSASNFALALKDNPAAVYLIYLLFFCVVTTFTYFFVKMISKLWVNYKTESNTDYILKKVDQNLTENVKVLGKVVLALERIKK